MTRSYAEDKIQASIVAYIRAVAPQCICFAVPNGGLRSKREAAKLKWTGTLAGVPDLIVLAPHGVTIGIEVKAPGGKPSREQIAIGEEMLTLGHWWHLARSIDDAREILKRAEVEMREAPREASSRSALATTDGRAA